MAGPQGRPSQPQDASYEAQRTPYPLIVIEFNNQRSCVLNQLGRKESIDPTAYRPAGRKLAQIEALFSQRVVCIRVFGLPCECALLEWHHQVLSRLMAMFDILHPAARSGLSASPAFEQ